MFPKLKEWNSFGNFRWVLDPPQGMRFTPWPSMNQGHMVAQAQTAWVEWEGQGPTGDRGVCICGDAHYWLKHLLWRASCCGIDKRTQRFVTQIFLEWELHEQAYGGFMSKHWKWELQGHAHGSLMHTLWNLEYFQDILFELSLKSFFIFLVIILEINSFKQYSVWFIHFTL